MSQNCCPLKKFLVVIIAAIFLAVFSGCAKTIVVGRSAPAKSRKPASTKPQPAGEVPAATSAAAVSSSADTVKKAEPVNQPVAVSSSPADANADKKEAAAEASTTPPPAKPQSSPIEERSKEPARQAPFKLDLSFGGTGIGDGLMDNPVGVAVDDLENIYVVDQGNSRIQKYDRFGIFQYSWGRQGMGDGEFTEENTGGTRILRETGEYEFNKPLGILLDTDQIRNLIRITVVDSLNYRLQRFLLTKNPGDRFPGDGPPSDQYPSNTQDVFLMLTNNLLTPVQHDDALQAKYSGGLRQVILDPVYILKADRALFAPFVWGKLGFAQGLLNLPGYLAIDEDGFLYVSDTENGRVQGFYVTPNNPDTDATFFREWGNAINLPLGQGKLEYPTAIAFDNAGFGGFLVLDKQQDGGFNIQRFDRSGQFLGVFGLSGDKEGKLRHPVAMAINPFDNTVFITDKGRRKVMVYNSKGEFMYEFGGEELSDPRGIAVLRNNYVYVTDAVKNMVYRYVPQ